MVGRCEGIQEKKTIIDYSDSAEHPVDDLVSIVFCHPKCTAGEAIVACSHSGAVGASTLFDLCNSVPRL